jgi:hypothetical protein
MQNGWKRGKSSPNTSEARLRRSQAGAARQPTRQRLSLFRRHFATARRPRSKNACITGNSPSARADIPTHLGNERDSRNCPGPLRLTLASFRHRAREQDRSDRNPNPSGNERVPDAPGQTSLLPLYKRLLSTHSGKRRVEGSGGQRHQTDRQVDEGEQIALSLLAVMSVGQVAPLRGPARDSTHQISSGISSGKYHFDPLPRRVARPTPRTWDYAGQRWSLRATQQPSHLRAKIAAGSGRPK